MKTIKSEEQLVQKLKALGHPSRLKIILFLEKGEQCVCKINELIEADQSTVSKHLALLKEAGLIADEKRGSFNYYQLTDKRIISLLKEF